ncbi:hypothetical protein OIU74_001431 [Salix koriyanagi]|uniref:Uncharacterized protein n=1 Tax=Salix koriyanagi TaxID=2511006 RepID=A0A9Q1AN16_9ROSI|nr:hypothetical protein OIU74_001431 [Salix koriyanagi]
MTRGERLLGLENLGFSKFGNREAEGDERQRETRGERLLVLENLGTERQRETRGGRREERGERRESGCVRKFRNREVEGGERREARGEAAERFQGKARCSSRVS